MPVSGERPRGLAPSVIARARRWGRRAAGSGTEALPTNSITL